MWQVSFGSRRRVLRGLQRDGLLGLLYSVLGSVLSSASFCVEVAGKRAGWLEFASRES